VEASPSKSDGALVRERCDMVVASTVACTAGAMVRFLFPRDIKRTRRRGGDIVLAGLTKCILLTAFLKRSVLNESPEF
jgi:hypothetical protein